MHVLVIRGAPVLPNRGRCVHGDSLGGEISVEGLDDVGTTAMDLK